MSLSPQQQVLFKEAVTCHQGGRVEQARSLYYRILEVAPRNADLLRFLGTAECQLGNAETGVGFLSQSLEIAPNQPEVYHNRGHALLKLGRFDEAVQSYDRAVALRPDYAPAWFSRGNALMDMDRQGEALASFDRVLAIQPNFIEALINRSDVLLTLESFTEAAASYDRVVTLKPELAYAWSNRGIALMKAGRFADALTSYDRALALDPAMVDAWSNRGDALGGLGRFEEAIDSCNKALSVRPDFATALNIRGGAELALRRFDEARASFERALTITPDYPEALSSLGGVLHNLGHHTEALERCDQAIGLRPGMAEAYNNRGTALLGLRRYDEALAAFEKALSIKPDSAAMHSNRGNAFQGLNRFGEAIGCYDQALRLDPDYAEAHNNRGNSLHQLDFIEEAAPSFARGMALRPDYPWVPGQALHNQMHLSDWTGFHERLEGMTARLREGEKAAEPFLLHALIDAPELQRKATETYSAVCWPEPPKASALALPPPHERMRVAYVSADFGEHPVAYLLAGMLEHHDRSRFEIYAISLRETPGPWRERIVNGVDHYIDVADRSDAEITAMLRDLEIDIAVDLNGYTQACRTAIFSGRAAPVQVSYIGFLGTMGVPYIDYLIADETIIPQNAQSGYAEKIAYLPTFQMNDDRQAASGKTFTRQALGLPTEGFVFCCFNQNYKITPDVFDSWMRILGRVPGSVLWLYVKSPAAVRNLQTEAKMRGIDERRLIFAPRMPLEDHLVRQSMAGLFLDTHPYNAGATASNALRSGLPVLTRIGQSFAARMGASLLEAAGLPELITRTPEAYEDLAVQLAQNPEQLATIRQKLAANLETCALFDTARSTRAIEAAYAAMYDRARAGLPPDHIYVPDLTHLPDIIQLKDTQ